MFLSLHDDLSHLLARPDGGQFTAPDTAPPKGWQPAVERSADEVRATTVAQPARTEEPDDADLLAQVGLDADTWQVSSVRKSSWQSASGEWLEAFKVSAVRRQLGAVDAAELAELRQQISLLGPPAGTFAGSWEGTGATFVVALADWQVGKGEGGGSAATVARIQRSLDDAAARLNELMLLGRPVERIALVGLGDLVEGCDGFYAMQAYQTDLTRREQVNVVRRLLLRAVRQFAEFGLPLVVATVAGNHGENRREGKAFTTFGDNDDVAVFEQVADVVAEAPAAFGDPSFAIPGDDLTLTLELSGVRVGIVHGHQFGTGSTAPAKAITWWQKQALGDQSVGAAQILLSGHLHHYTCAPHGRRTHFQTPSLDGSSTWYRNVAGVDSPPGMLTLLVGEACGPTGWQDVQVLCTD